MEINKLLVTGRMYKELQLLQDVRPDKRFRFRAESEVTVSDMDWADAYIGFRPVPAFQFGSLQWVHALGAGVDAFLFRKQWKPDVKLTRTIGDFGSKIAEYCLSYMLADLQLHSALEHNQKQAVWAPAPPAQLREQRAVVFGTGTIGQEIARVLSALGVDATGVSLSGQHKSAFRHVATIGSAREHVSSAHWVINTLPLTESTYRLFDRQLFDTMDGAAFINVGRGSSVDSRALLEALDRKSVRLAVLDVFEEEPLPSDSPLWRRPDVRITPHISAITGLEEAAQAFLATLEQLEAGAAPANLADPARGY